MVATGCTRGKVQATGREFDVSEMHLWTIEDGRVVRFESYIDSSMMCEVWRLWFTGPLCGAWQHNDYDTSGLIPAGGDQATSNASADSSTLSSRAPQLCL